MNLATTQRAPVIHPDQLGMLMQRLHTHAGIKIDNHGFIAIHFKHMMRTNNSAHSAAGAFFLIQF